VRLVNFSFVCSKVELSNELCGELENCDELTLYADDNDDVVSMYLDVCLFLSSVFCSTSSFNCKSFI
jgi:hypothetical protein